MSEKSPIDASQPCASGSVEFASVTSNFKVTLVKPLDSPTRDFYKSIP